MTADIGPLLRSARLKRSMSLRSLASAVGVSASLISQVETGKTRPSVSTLYALTNYLGLSMDDLLGIVPPLQANDTPLQSPDIAQFGQIESVIQRADDNPCLEMDNGVRWERLAVAGDAPADPLLVSYSPGASSSIEGKLMRHNGYEYAYILEGELTLQLEFDTYVLSKGDSLQFDSVRPHMYANYSSATARGVWFVVGRRRQNKLLPDVMERSSVHAEQNSRGLKSAVDVLHAMDRLG